MSSCAPCAAAAAARASGQVYTGGMPRTAPDPNCQMTSEVLYQWRTMLRCLKDSGRYSTIGINLHEINAQLGIIQSAINYPDDYCYYSSRFAYFQNDILPLIIANVTECI